MSDNEVEGQEAMVLMRLRDELTLAEPGIGRVLAHIMSDTAAEWDAYLRGLAQ